ncbi:MAG TPA: cation-translocating P-type ATPase [Gemmatimonadaceae bacterium]|nr:cation-translocating P-type ATPase [Gemmatimonadaceae bacterium]
MGAPDVRHEVGTAPPSWHALPATAVLERLESSPRGLTTAEARSRLARFGRNVLPPPRPRSALRILADNFRSLVVLLLIVAAGIAAVTGDPADALAIAGVLVITVAVGFFTELRARRSVDALLRLDVARATVRRDGHLVPLEAGELVPGDVVELEAGQAVPADCRLLQATELAVNEAPLTGESLPVTKRADPPADADAPLAERPVMVYKSTVVVTGRAHAVVTDTGVATEVGRIGAMMSEVREAPTPIERRLDALGAQLIWLALGVAVLVGALAFARGAPLGDVLATAIALAVAAVPEGLPVIATIAMGVGVRRMARRNAIVRRLPAVESLGSATVICTDKTGTLTTGEMAVTTLWVAGREHDVATASNGGSPPLGEARLEDVLRVAALANRAELHDATDPSRGGHGDPTEVALLVAAHRAGVDRQRLRMEWPEIGEIPFSSERQLMATFHRERDGRVHALVKGAPGRLLAICDRVATPAGERPLDEEERGRLRAVNEGLARRGLRVLALASGDVEDPTETAVRALTFLGYAGMMDPPAPGARATIERVHAAGIRVLMLTGDQRLTAETVARGLGLLREGDEVLDGRELQRVADDTLAVRLRRVGAISRVSPADKLRIVTALQEDGEIVAMIGDGVNDAPALRKADVGVAMGGRGTAVAKEAAAVVLQDDRFETIGAAVEEGRVIFQNVRKFIFYLFSCNLAEILLLLVASLAGLPTLLPIQILWLNLVTDTFPALALAMEPREAEVMRRPPVSPRAPLLSRALLREIGVFAVLIAGPALAAMRWSGGGSARALTLGFTTLALAQLFHLGNARSSGPVTSPRAAAANPYALAALAAGVLLQAAALHVTALARLLGTVPLEVRDWALAAALGAVPAVVGQVLKSLRPRPRLRPGPVASR